MGAPRPEWLKANRDILLMQIKNTRSQTVQPVKFQLNQVWSMMSVFLPRQTVRYVVKPITVTAVIVGMVMGSWVTTVSASYNSLPGGVLYQVKLATESMQTSLAAKPQETKLRVEFAGRRAEEVKKIVKSNISKKEKKAKVETAMNSLKKDLEQVRGNLEEMKKPALSGQTTSVAQVVETAKIVEQKTTEIQKSLDQTSAQLKIEAAPAGVAPVEEMKQASAAVAETGAKAVEVLVKKHQEDKNSMTQADVKNAVDNQIKNLEEKMSQVNIQLNEVTSSTLSATRQEKQATANLVTPVKETAEVAKESISKAKEELAKDNFSGALDKLKEGTILTQAAEIKTDAVKILAAPPVIAATSTLPLIAPLKEELRVSTSTPAATGTVIKK